jgi:hypothetical protein
MFSKQEKEAVNFKEIYSILDNTYHWNSTLKESQDKKVRNIIDTWNKIIKIFFLKKGWLQRQVYWKN